MSYIITPKPTVTVNMVLVEEKLEAYFTAENELLIAKGIKPRPAFALKKKNQMLAVVKHLIIPQIAERYRLDLSDEKISELLGTSARSSQRLRLEMKDAGIVFFWEWSRPKKKGDYPYWMVREEFIIHPEFKKHVPAGPKTSKTYNQAYCTLWDNVKASFAADLKESGSKLSPEAFNMTMNILVRERINNLGLEKVDFLK